MLLPSQSSSYSALPPVGIEPYQYFIAYKNFNAVQSHLTRQIAELLFSVVERHAE